MTKQVFSAQPYNIGDKIKGTVDSILDSIASKVQPEGHKTKGQQVGDTLSSGHGGVRRSSTHVPSSWHEQSTQYCTRAVRLPSRAVLQLIYRRRLLMTMRGSVRDNPGLRHLFRTPQLVASYDVSPSGPLVSATSSSATSSTTQDPFDTSSKLQSLNLSMRKTMIASSNSGPCSGPSSSGIDCPHAFWLAAVVPYLIWRCFYSERSS